MSLNPYRPPSSIPDAENRLVAEPGEARSPLNRLPAKLEYVNGAVEMAMAELTNGIHASATEVCRMAMQVAFDLNGSDGPLMLDDLGLSRSEDIGAAIDELIAIGVIQPDDKDTTDDFAGLYDTSAPPSSWVVQWEVGPSEDGG